MPQPAERLRFNLAHTFTGDTHLATNFFEGVSLSIQEPVTQLQDAHFARGQTVQDFGQMFF